MYLKVYTSCFQLSCSTAMYWKNMCIHTIHLNNVVTQSNSFMRFVTPVCCKKLVNYPLALTHVYKHIFLIEILYVFEHAGCDLYKN